MEYLKVVSFDNDCIVFDNGVMLYSEHEQDCCEHHYLSFGDLTKEDFEDVRFDLTNDSFFNRVEDYGIELIPIIGHPIRIPAYGENNGYYSSDLTLILEDSNHKILRKWDITECQDVNWG